MEQSRRGCVGRQRQCGLAVVGYGHGARSRGFWLMLGAGAGWNSCGALCSGQGLVCAAVRLGGWAHTRAEQQETGQGLFGTEQDSACGGSEIRGITCNPRCVVKTREMGWM